MPSLAREFTVVAADARGVGLSNKPETGYDSGTQASDMVALMSALSHERFAMVGHDVGMWTGYALAVDHPERLEETAVAHYVEPLSRSPEALRASFAIYRAVTENIARNAERAATMLTLPVLTIAGERSTGPLVAQTLTPVTRDLRSIELPDCGHFPAEEAPAAMLAAVTDFLVPRRAAAT